MCTTGTKQVRHIPEMTAAQSQHLPSPSPARDGSFKVRGTEDVGLVRAYLRNSGQATTLRRNTLVARLAKPSLTAGPWVSLVRGQQLSRDSVMSLTLLSYWNSPTSSRHSSQKVTEAALINKA